MKIQKLGWRSISIDAKGNCEDGGKKKVRRENSMNKVKDKRK